MGSVRSCFLLLGKECPAKQLHLQLRFFPHPRMHTQGQKKQDCRMPAFMTHIRQSQDSAKIPDLSSLKDAFGNVMDKARMDLKPGVRSHSSREGNQACHASWGVLVAATRMLARIEGVLIAFPASASV